MNFTVTPVLRLDQPDKNGLCPINVYVYTKGEKIKFAIREKVHPNDWDSEKKKVKRENPMAILINLKIEKQVADIKLKIITAMLGKLNENDFNIRSLLQGNKSV